MKRAHHHHHGGKPPSEMVVCFPTRAHLSLIPKPICSPARPSEIAVAGRRHHRRQKSHHFRSSSIRGGNPNLDVSEPSSPKVTCAGQIKVRPRRRENWRTVMAELERIHGGGGGGKQKKSAWGEALRFVTCLRNLRLDFRCFGGIPEADVTSDEDEEEDDGGAGSRSRGVFTSSSDWYMIVNEGKGDEDEAEGYNFHKKPAPQDEDESQSPAPPPNALLLMRCRSAPAKSWQEEEEEQDKKPKTQQEEGEGGIKNRLVVMRCGENFSRFSGDVVEETWLVGGMFPRSRSCRR